MIIQLTEQQLQALKAEADETYPVESCALLFGETTTREYRVKQTVIVKNVLKSASRFEISPEEFAAAFTKAEKEGLEFVGFFHSHPASASPSSVDFEFMKLWADAVWLIWSSVDRRFAAFQMKNEKVREVAVAVKTDKL